MTELKHHQSAANALYHLLPKRALDAHKGDCGSVAIIGGADSMLGAVLLAARAALYCGAGRVYASMLSHAAPMVDMMQPEIMLRRPADLLKLNQLDCLAIGPGLGQSQEAIELLTFWLSKPVSVRVPLVLDADALNLIAQHVHLADLLRNYAAPVLITPHAGEAARLLGVTAEEVQRERENSARTLAKNLNVVCVLKGAASVCADEQNGLFVNATGNPGLASGGTGDVLTGFAASLIAQGLQVFDAARLAVMIHGQAADNLVKQGVGVIGITASELILEIRHVMNSAQANN